MIDGGGLMIECWALIHTLLRYHPLQRYECEYESTGNHLIAVCGLDEITIHCCPCSLPLIMTIARSHSDRRLFLLLLLWRAVQLANSRMR